MPDVHADPEKLRQFAKALTSSADQLQEVARGMSRSLERTGWQDAERVKFEQDYRQMVKALSQFSEQLRSQYAPVVQRKAAALEQFRRR